MPLDIFHIDHLDPLPSTKKSYVHVFVVVEAFSKFMWLYVTKSTSAAEMIGRLKKQSSVFGNPRRIISDRGSAFTSKEFKFLGPYEIIRILRNHRYDLERSHQGHSRTNVLSNWLNCRIFRAIRPSRDK